MINHFSTPLSTTFDLITFGKYFYEEEEAILLIRLFGKINIRNGFIK